MGILRLLRNQVQTDLIKPVQKQPGGTSRELLCAAAHLWTNLFAKGTRRGLVKAAQKSSARKSLWQLPLAECHEVLPDVFIHLAGPVHSLQKLNATSPLRAAICPWPRL